MGGRCVTTEGCDSTAVASSLAGIYIVVIRIQTKQSVSHGLPLTCSPCVFPLEQTARKTSPRQSMPSEDADNLYERSPPHTMPARAGTALMSREICRVAGHRVTSASGRSPRRMSSRWARLRLPSGRTIVLQAHVPNHTLQCTAHRRAAARGSAHPVAWPLKQVKKLNLAVFPVR